jgi:hypothetical protein
MFPLLARKGANGKRGALPTWYGLLQVARFVMVH